MFHNVEDHAFAPVVETFACVYEEEEKYDNVKDHTKIAHTNIPCVRMMTRRRRTMQGMKMR